MIINALYVPRQTGDVSCEHFSHYLFSLSVCQTIIISQQPYVLHHLNARYSVAQNIVLSTVSGNLVLILVYPSKEDHWSLNVPKYCVIFVEWKWKFARRIKLIFISGISCCFLYGWEAILFKATLSYTWMIFMHTCKEM